MSEMTQEKRILELETTLGKDVLLITEMSGSEALSSLFSCEVKAFSEKEKVAPEDIIGKRAGVVLKLPSGEQRYFHGMVNPNCITPTTPRTRELCRCGTAFGSLVSPTFYHRSLI